MSHPFYPENNVIYYNTDEMTQSFCFNGHQKNWVNDEDETHDESISQNWGILLMHKIRPHTRVFDFRNVKKKSVTRMM